MTNGAPKRASHEQRQHDAVAPDMERLRAYYRHKNITGLNYILSIILGTVAFSYGSVPMYKMICQTTGWGGQPVRAPGHGSGGDDVDPASRLVPVEDAKRIRVTFNASVSDILPWKFTPQQREVRVLPGETALAFYTATNTSDKDIIGVATYSVTPAQTAAYFSKIQCFCFEEQRLNAGETVDMPVFFYLDPDLLNDMNMKGVETVTLSYTFFSKWSLCNPASSLSLCIRDWYLALYSKLIGCLFTEARYDDNGNFKHIAPAA
ncbi:putative Cytochrome c oxidase assembly protein COX11 [Seiridium cardinale]